MNYEKLLEGIPRGTSIYYLKVPTCKIDYIEIPELIQITKIDDATFFSPTMGIDRSIERLTKTFSNCSNSILFGSTIDEVKKEFSRYYLNYVVALKEELDFLVEAVPNLQKTDFLKDVV